ncbi:MAG: CPBP family intramembrane metalloprotease [Deltaproteobacteria bacterium]|nr:CPBP family intramembrane metalloprotease [Deltaproteobacteria bacterium]
MAFISLTRLSELHPRRFFLETWRAVDLESETERAARSGYDYRPLIALSTAAVSLILMEYLGSARQLNVLIYALEDVNTGALDGMIDVYYKQSRFFTLFQHAWWALWRVTGYFAIPAIVIKWVFRERLCDWGLQTKGIGEHIWIYFVCFIPVLALVVLMSFRGDFLNYYPFYEKAGRSWIDLLIWELLYAAQFFALEFFFRGFWLKACKSAMGSSAIMAMVVPYCMIHFGKPWPEVLAAIVAGIVLGTLALKTRSIWNGVFIHLSVALSMDLAALIQTNRFPSLLWPR